MDDVTNVIGELSLSVAIATRNRPESLRRTLSSLRCQDLQPLEIIVADDSDEPHRACVAAIAAEAGAEYVPGARRGLYANRNRSILACKGTHVRTMDDDHELPAGHLAACISAMLQDPNAIWIIGEFLPEQRQDGAVPCPGQLHPRGFSVLPKDPQNCWALADGATIFPRPVFLSGERYTERFVFGGAYLEFGSRLHWRGYRIRHLKSTYVVHHAGPERSITDQVAIEAANTYAMLCHSFIYQPSLSNRGLCGMEVVRRLILHGRWYWRSLFLAMSGFLAARASYRRPNGRPNGALVRRG